MPRADALARMFLAKARTLLEVKITLGIWPTLCWGPCRGVRQGPRPLCLPDPRQVALGSQHLCMICTAWWLCMLASQQMHGLGTCRGCQPLPK